MKKKTNHYKEHKIFYKRLIWSEFYTVTEAATFFNFPREYSITGKESEENNEDEKQPAE